MKPNLSKQRFG